MQGGTGQNGPKGGPHAITMCFGTVLDHLEAIGPHLEAEKIYYFDILLTFFDMSEICQGWAPAVQCSARPDASRGKKITKIAQKKNFETFFRKNAQHTSIIMEQRAVVRSKVEKWPFFAKKSHFQPPAPPPEALTRTFSATP